MDYLEMLEIQERIIDYEKRLRDKISFIDSNGNRKLDPYYFLSGEVAAYKLLRSWIKKMEKGEDFITDEILDLVDLIEVIIEGDYEDYQEYEADYSMPLWNEIVKTFSSDALASFNAEVMILASLAEVSQGTTPERTLICTMSDKDLTDAEFTSYAYSVVHDYLLSFSKEELEKFAQSGFGINANKGNLYKLHFNLFQ